VAIANRDFQNACTPGYYNNEGGERSGGLNGQTYTPGINRFNKLLAEWRDEGNLQGLELHFAEPAHDLSGDDQAGGGRRRKIEGVLRSGLRGA
jgi:hypothetical protein